MGAVQGNGPAEYVDEHEPNAVLDSQLDSSASLEDEQVDIVLWPEGSVDSDPLTDKVTAQVLNDASADGHLVHNTSFLWTETGTVGTYAKRHPVPFREYAPDRWFYDALVPSLVNLLQREYAAGADSPVIDIDGAAVGLAICFEVVLTMSSVKEHRATRRCSCSRRTTLTSGAPTRTCNSLPLPA